MSPLLGDPEPPENAVLRQILTKLLVCPLSSVALSLGAVPCSLAAAAASSRVETDSVFPAGHESTATPVAAWLGQHPAEELVASDDLSA